MIPSNFQRQESFADFDSSSFTTASTFITASVASLDNLSHHDNQQQKIPPPTFVSFPKCVPKTNSSDRIINERHSSSHCLPPLRRSISTLSFLLLDNVNNGRWDAIPPPPRTSKSTKECNYCFSTCTSIKQSQPLKIPQRRKSIDCSKTDSLPVSKRIPICRKDSSGRGIEKFKKMSQGLVTYSTKLPQRRNCHH